jgi:hypothetical protein
VSIGLNVKKIVYRYDLQGVGMSLQDGLQNLPADPTKTINADPSHNPLL